MKKKRALYNLIMGIGSKVILLGLGFIIPKLFIENYGSDMNGLLSSIAQVFAYLGLVEAGISVATTQALYKAVAVDDWKNINAILNAATKFYKRTGLLYLFGVICTAAIYPFLVPNPMQFFQVFLLIVFSGLGNVFSYFFQSKYIALLNTEGKTYIHVAIGTMISIVSQILKIIMVSCSVDIVLIYFVFFLVSIIQIVLLNIYIQKNYRMKLDKSVTPNISALSQHNSVLVHQISSLIFSNTDVMILTIFSDLQNVSIYTIYNMIVSNIGNLVNTALDSFTSALGLLYNENRNRFYYYYDIFELNSWMIYFILMSTTLLLYEPFIRLYTANADINYVVPWLPLFFVSNQLLSMVRMPGLKVMNIEGCFKDTQSRTIIESVINLIVSLITVQFWGIYGVLLGTFVALCYRSIDIIIYSNNKILKRDFLLIFERLFRNLLIMVLLQYIFYQYTSRITSAVSFFLWGVGITCITTILYLLVNIMFEWKNENVRLFVLNIKRKML